MTNIANLMEVLTYEFAPQRYVLSPGQSYLRGGPQAQPFVGAVRDRPVQGQVWPRGEHQPDATVGNNIPGAPPFVASVTVDPSSITFAVGETQPFTATVFDQFGNPMSGPGITISWSSTNTAKVTVNPITGIATGVANGSASVVATCQGRTGSSSVTIVTTPLAVDHMEILWDSTGLPVQFSPWYVFPSATVQLRARCFDSNNVILSGRVVTWDTDNHAKATVSGTGLVTWVARGDVTVTATSEGKHVDALGTSLPAPDVTDPVYYFSCDGDTKTKQSPILDIILSTGRIAETAFAEGQRGIVTGKRGNGRKLGAILSGANYGGLFAGAPLLAFSKTTPWSVAVWANRAEGRWGIDASSKMSCIVSTAFFHNAPYVLPLVWRRIDAGLVRLYAEAWSGNTPSTAFASRDTGMTETDIPASGWYHLAVVNKLSDNTLKVYLNGTLFYTGAAIDVTGHGIEQVLFDEWGAFASRLPGFVIEDGTWGGLDELYVFDRALTGAEVTTLASI